MSQLENVLEKITKQDITILASRPLSGKVQITSEFLYHYALKENKKALLFYFGEDDTFYLSHLIAKMIKEPRRKIESYFHPCRGIEHSIINEKAFLDAIHQLQESSIYFNSQRYLVTDYLDYLLEFNDLESFDYLIIDNFDLLLKNSKYKTEEVIKKLKENAKKHHTHIILWNNVSRKVENFENRTIKLSNITHYRVTQKYVDYVILLSRNRTQNQITLKDYIKGQQQQKIEFYYDRELGTLEEL